MAVGASGSGKTNIVMYLIILMENTFDKIYLYMQVYNSLKLCQFENGVWLSQFISNGQKLFYQMSVQTYICFLIY